jgi:hypothetical protein
MEKAVVGIRGEESQFLAELFHALNQPITALRCTLELNLHTPRTERQYQQALETALEKAEEISRWTSGIGDLVQPPEMEAAMEMIPLGAVLRDALEHFSPVLKARGLEYALITNGECQVRLARQRLQQTIFYVLEFVMQAALPGDKLKICQRSRGGSIRVELVVLPGTALPWRGKKEDDVPPSTELWQQLTLAIARHNLEVAGGRLEIDEHSRELRIDIHLPNPANPGGDECTSGGGKNFPLSK